ncbi:MAG: M20 family metallopeptidase [Desulfohalobiaceae bacterium]
MPTEQELAEQIQAYLEPRQKQMLDLLRELVLIQSSSRNKPGLDRMAEQLAQAMPQSLQAEILPQSEYGNMLLVRSKKAAVGQKQLLLLGHTDTVFPEDTDFNYFHEDEDQAYGPGVIDMKGGLVCGIFALLALQELGLLSEIPVAMLCNSDEEIGSPASWELISQEAERSFAGFVLECGGLEGEIVTGRKGRKGYLLQVQGQAGHAAQADKTKPSAILELAHKIIALEELNQPPAITLNVGRIQGGIGPNTVAKQAQAFIDLRFLQEKDGQSLEQRMQEILANPHIPGTSCHLSYQTGRPPMPQSRLNQELFRLVHSRAEMLGQKVRPELRNGVSDANILASKGVPVLDGLGPMGDMDHSEDEYLLKSSLVPRACLLAICIWSCCQNPQGKSIEESLT